MPISKTLKEVLRAGFAYVALFAGAPVAWSQTTPSLITSTAPVVPLTGQTSVVLTDQANLSGESSFPGLINFTLTGPGGFFSATQVTVNGNGTYSTPSGILLPTSGPVAGTYSWNAVYVPNIGLQVIAPTEQTVVSAAIPGLSTTASSGGLGSILRDSALLQGGTIRREPSFSRWLAPTT
jgi:hypothetical protein